MPTLRRLLLLASVVCLAGGTALAQGSSGGGGSSGSGSGGAAGSPGGLPGQGGASSGPTGPGRRAQSEEQLRNAGVAPSPQQNEQQLRDLNAISRELGAGGNTVPAPEAEPGAPRR